MTEEFAQSHGSVRERGIAVRQFSPMKQKTEKKLGTYKAKFAAGFTLIELLIVIAIIAALAVVVVLTLNPAELLRQSRDADRTSALNSLNEAINLSQTNGLSLASSSVVYVSIPDSSPTCADLGLPALQSGWAYGCAPSSTYTQTNGTGWVPINFASQNTGSPLSVLPVDPINTTSTGLYYTYITNGTQWELMAMPESQKYQAQLQANPELSGYPSVMAQGSNFTFSPIFDYNSGLAGWWMFNEGSGTIAYDSSGNGNNGTLFCHGTSCSIPSWTTGKVGSSALYFNTVSASVFPYVSSNFVNVPSVSGSALSISLWINPNASQIGSGWFIRNGIGNDENYGFNLGNLSGGYYSITMTGYSGGFQTSAATNYIVPANSWSQIVLIFTQGQNFQVYLNGVFQQTLSFPYITTLATTHLNIGGNSGAAGQTLNAYIEGVRIYNRALSPAEIEAIYNSGT